MGMQFSLYLTVICAYLVVAYMVGSKLSGRQALIVSTLFIFAAGGQTWGMYASLIRAKEYLAEKARLFYLTDYEQNFEANTVVWIFILALGILASLYFMWSVRHPKTG